MMIMEMPRRARVARSSGGIVARFFEPIFSRRSKFNSRGPINSPPPEPTAELRRAVPLPEKRAGSNAPLSSLAGGIMASRFHAWHGASGRRYICSVFAVDGDDPHGGMPDFAEAIALAVGKDEGHGRRCLSTFLFDGSTDLSARNAFVASALAAGAVAWHIHLADDPHARLAIAKDIELGRSAQALSA